MRQLLTILIFINCIISKSTFADIAWLKSLPHNFDCKIEKLILIDHCFKPLSYPDNHPPCIDKKKSEYFELNEYFNLITDENWQSFPFFEANPL